MKAKATPRPKPNYLTTESRALDRKAVTRAKTGADYFRPDYYGRERPQDLRAQDRSTQWAMWKANQLGLSSFRDVVRPAHAQPVRDAMAWHDARQMEADLTPKTSEPEPTSRPGRRHGYPVPNNT